jgi:hypothetical protein
MIEIPYQEVFDVVLQVLKVSWWVILPVGLFFIWNELWLWGMNRIWKLSLQWVLLEIKIPKNILKTPKAMENVFAALHGIYNGVAWEDRYLKGADLPWFTCELIGYAGGVRFYIRCPAINRNLVESAIYSEYPDAEVVEAEDYTQLLPEVLPNDIYDIYGQEFILAKSSSYPIRTYEFFEAPTEEHRLDPIAAITEIMSRLKEGEAIWLQYLIQPVSDEWKKEGEELRDKIMQRKKTGQGDEGWVEGFMQFLRNLFIALIEHPTWSSGSKEEKEKMLHLSPGELNVLKGIENKISKLGFNSVIRFIYIDRQASFTISNISSVNGAFKQFNTLDMNSFKVIGDTVTYITARKLTYKSWFRKRRILYRKRLMYDMYKLRWFPAVRNSILNTEELATIFHFPLVSVGAPLLRRIETRKGEPPAHLPIG